MNWKCDLDSALNEIEVCLCFFFFYLDLGKSITKSLSNNFWKSFRNMEIRNVQEVDYCFCQLIFEIATVFDI